jgi:AAHS family 4-hydroxybenzoate transporter-like MFS transporter
MPDSSTVDPIHLLETGRWTGYQKALTLLAAIAVIFDGFDIQILGFAIPSIMREWHVARAAFSPILALGMAGMAAGSPLAGYVGDRFGRRTALIGCVFLFGGATILTASSHGLLELAALRFLTGMGAGGALPNAGTLSSEFAPMRWRPVAVTFTIVCVPLGGMIGGVAAGQILPALGWRAMYVLGGAAPILLSILLLLALPESPRFLARHPRRRQELVRLLRRMGHAVPVDALFEDVRTDIRAVKVPLRSLFAGALLRETIGLWLAFFACLNGIYLVFGWLPTMLTAKGFGVATASSGLAAYNFGGVVGVVVCAAAASLIGSRRPLILAAIAGVVSAAGLLFIPLDPAGSQLPVIIGFALIGFFANAVQTTMFALAAHVYSTEVRASGMAAATAAGRIGGLLSSFAGAAIIQAGSGPYLGMLAVSMAVTAAGLAIMKDHFGGTAGAKKVDLKAHAVPNTSSSVR